MTDQQIAPFELRRDTWGRPFVVPPGGGRTTAYTRCTTYVAATDEKTTLHLWSKRNVAIGLAMNEGLLSEVQQADMNDSKTLNKACDRAEFMAGGHDGRNKGTYLHALTEAYDKGEDPDRVPMPALAKAVPQSAFKADLAAYAQATRELEWTHIEEFMVHDSLMIGGTPDRIVKLDGKSYIADLKTGSLERGSLTIAAQLAVYSRSKLYDWRSAAALGDEGTKDEAAALRSLPVPDMDFERGLVIHLPAGEATCHLMWVDLVKGWDAVRVCRDIRTRRDVSYRHLFKPADQPQAPVVILATAIANARTKEELTALWEENTAQWTEELTAMAKQRILSL